MEPEWDVGGVRMGCGWSRNEMWVEGLEVN